MEKLLRTCHIDTIYVLIRSKKGKDIATRIEDIINDVVRCYSFIYSFLFCLCLTVMHLHGAQWSRTHIQFVIC